MRLTTKGRYAVTAMLDVALNDSKGPVTLADIAQRQGISQSYLEQLFSNLKKNGLVNGIRGPTGGYQLRQNRDQISVAEVIDAVNESVDATRCGGQKNCRKNDRCLTHDLWADLSNEIRSFLESVTLEALANKQLKETIKITRKMNAN